MPLKWSRNKDGKSRRLFRGREGKSKSVHKSGQTQYLQIAEYGREEVHPARFLRGDLIGSRRRSGLRGPEFPWFSSASANRRESGAGVGGGGCGFFSAGVVFPSPGGARPAGRLNLLVRARDSLGAPSPSLESVPQPSGTESPGPSPCRLGAPEAAAVAVRRSWGRAGRAGSADSSAPGAGEARRFEAGGCGARNGRQAARPGGCALHSRSARGAVRTSPALVPPLVHCSPMCQPLLICPGMSLDPRPTHLPPPHHRPSPIHPSTGPASSA